MIELLYDEKTLARIIIERDMSAKQAHQFLREIWEYDKEYLYLDYRFNKKKFMLDVMDEVNYWENKVVWDKEITAVNRDLEAIGSECRYFSEDDYYDIRSYFMEMRLRIIFLDNQNFIRMKLRTLLRDHGYKRRTAGLNEYLKRCVYFYHIEIFVRGGEKCDIGNISLDDMVTFRVLQNIRHYIVWEDENL